MYVDKRWFDFIIVQSFKEMLCKYMCLLLDLCTANYGLNRGGLGGNRANIGLPCKEDGSWCEYKWLCKCNVTSWFG